MITVEDVITMALPAGTTLVAGGAGVGREVTWAARIRSAPPAFGYLAGGELVLLPVSVLSQLDEQLKLDEAVTLLAELGVAGAAVLGTIGKAARDAADAAGLPLLSLPAGSEVDSAPCLPASHAAAIARSAVATSWPTRTVRIGLRRARSIRFDLSAPGKAEKV